MKVLVLNSGSSSVKYQLFDMRDQSILAKGLVQRIGIEGSELAHVSTGKEPYKTVTDIPSHGAALGLIFDVLTNSEYGIIQKVEEIDAIGHRVVHGGEVFKHAVLVDDSIKDSIRDLIALAPLHNPANLLGIEECEKIIPGIRQVAVFDTSFHQTIPQKAYMYSLPYRYYEDYGIRKYGFHGTSHQYVAQRAAKMLDKPLEELNIITCHLGNGASITAIRGGKSVDTSMGFTPLEGLAMGTRSGDLDPAIITFLMKKENLSPENVDKILNNQSGVLGISGISSDFRDLEKAAGEGNERAKLAMDMFIHRVRKYIGSYAAELNGVDALVFTAGLGENSPEIRAGVCDGLDFLNLWIDPEKNNVRGKETVLSTDNSKGKVLLIPTNEELAIALQTVELVG